MRIGEFAKAAGIPASVLRHYDKKGLLIPDYIDDFTGYRHYSAAQIADVRRIALLKEAGFSLLEIRRIMESPMEKGYIEELIKRHQKKHQIMLVRLQEVRKIMLEQNGKLPDTAPDANGITEEVYENGEIILRSAPFRLPPDSEELREARQKLEEEAAKRDYQRISDFMTQEDPGSSTLQVFIRTVRLHSEMTFLCENIDVPFENDERVVGKWKVLGDYAVKEDFFSGMADAKESGHGGKERVLYFLPGGERYWIYGWTKDYLILETGDQQCLCRYEIEEYGGKRYLFAEEKGYEFRRGGRPLILVLEQLDQKEYTKEEIMIKDDLDMPFQHDERVLGIWKSYDFIYRKEDFEVGKSHISPTALIFKKMCFEREGVVTSQYGDEIIGPDKQCWTKGYVLRHYNHTACAYELLTVDGRDYMIIEWKSGDYRWGGHCTSYYVFVKEQDLEE